MDMVWIVAAAGAVPEGGGHHGGAGDLQQEHLEAVGEETAVAAPGEHPRERSSRARTAPGPFGGAG